ncbi:MAG: HIT domain-containing protein [Bacteroidota bacterium]
MDKLWSPWRSNYIESFKNEKDPGKCIFCDALNENLNDENSLKVFDGKSCFVMMNLYPYNSGHIMIIPKKHVSGINLLDNDELHEIMETTQLAIKVLDRTIKPHGYNFGANLGKAAGAGIDDHIHFHIVPRWNGDTNFMTTLGDVKVISQDLLQTKKQLIEAFKQIIG